MATSMICQLTRRKSSYPKKEKIKKSVDGLPHPVVTPSGDKVARSVKPKVAPIPDVHKKEAIEAAKKAKAEEEAKKAATTTTKTPAAAAAPVAAPTEAKVTKAVRRSLLDPPGSRFKPATLRATDDGADFASAKVVPIGERMQTAPHLYTNAPIRQHSTDDIGKYYEVADRKRVPKWLASTFEDELRTSGGYMMIRRASYNLVERMRKISGNTVDAADKHEVRGQVVAVEGGRGCGKSATLHYATQYAMSSGWLVVSTIGEQFLSERLGMIRKNKNHDGLFDLPPFTMDWLRTFAESQAAQLKQIKLKNTYSWKMSHETTDAAGQPVYTLYDLVRSGFRKGSLNETGSITIDVMNEVRLATEIPVLVVIDNVNYWQRDTQYPLPSNHFRTIPIKDISIGHAFQTFLTKAPVNGLSLIAGCSHASEKAIPQFIKAATRRYMVRPYSDNELAHAVHHYHISGLAHRELAMEPEFLGRIKMTTQNIPREVLLDAIRN